MRPRTGMAAAALLAMGLMGACLFLGQRVINPFAMNYLEREIIFSIRLPRVIVAALMGAALGASGAVLQCMLRNPLADPYILGLSSGATLAAAFALMGAVSLLGPFTVPAFAFAGAMLTAMLVGGMGYKRGGIVPERLLLAGIGVGFLFSAVLMLVMSVSSSEGLRRAVLWIFGDLGMADWRLIPWGAVFIAAGLLLALSRAKALNALMLGDELAHSLGFSPRREAFLLFTSVALMTAASVSLGGMVGFVGLLMPHVMRVLSGPDARALVPASALGGAGLLMVSDLVGRTIVSPSELPAGIMTALIGAPYFLYLLRRRDVIGG